MEILSIKQSNQKEVIKKAVKIIKEGGVLVFPTDTVYGLLADATNKKAVEKIFKIKKREKEKAIPILIKDLKMAKKLANINREQENFLLSAWPGKTTAVLIKKDFKIKIFGTDRETIALRIPNYNLINSLFLKINIPLVGTSANISGRPASTKIEKIIKQFERQKIKPDLIIDEGNLLKNKPSAVIDLVSKKIKILRKG